MTPPWKIRCILTVFFFVSCQNISNTSRLWRNIVKSGILRSNSSWFPLHSVKVPFSPCYSKTLAQFWESNVGWNFAKQSSWFPAHSVKVPQRSLKIGSPFGPHWDIWGPLYILEQWERFRRALPGEILGSNSNWLEWGLVLNLSAQAAEKGWAWIISKNSTFKGS